jgi:hypothetical protein
LHVMNLEIRKYWFLSILRATSYPTTTILEVHHVFPVEAFSRSGFETYSINLSVTEVASITGGSICSKSDYLFALSVVWFWVRIWTGIQAFFSTRR